MSGRWRPARSGARCRSARSWPGRRWDDLRLMGLKLVFLIASRAVSVLGLSRRESWWKDAEILMLRHQLAVAQCERPKASSRLTWPDRAWLALLAGTQPMERLAAMRLSSLPGTILRWHREHRPPPVGARCRAVPGPAPGSAPQCAAGSAAPSTGELVLGLPPDPRRARRARHYRGAVHGLADPQDRWDRPGAAP